MDDKEAFLSRWSRRKLEAKAEPTAVPPAVQPGAATGAPAAPAAPAQTARPEPDESPEYRNFFDPKVDKKLRHAALKSLFSDPHFNVVDGLDVYIDDYSKADPIPPAMLRQLNQAKNLLLFEEENQAGAGAQREPAQTEEAGAAVVAAPTGAPSEAFGAGGSAADTAGATGAAAAAPARRGEKNN
jgi:hypothetical protein